MFDLSNCRFAFLDLETTGLSPWFGDRVCEVGIVLTEGKRIKHSFQQLVNPQRPLSPAAASTNRLNDAELALAPTFPEIIRQIEAMLKDAVVVCHNASFDLQFLDEEYRRAGQELQITNLIDTLLLARNHFSFPSNSLTNIASEFEIQNPEAHRALADALTDKNIFFAMMELLLQNGNRLEDFIGVYNSPAWPKDEIHLPTDLAEAIKSKQRLQLDYVDKNGERSTRQITPIDVRGLSDYIYLRAHCHLRHDERTFRLDRIVALKFA
ncbi:MAG: exonuclease domain-containing protein [Anaerolineales bacterium]|nr:exonuclease domain-containing protein [Anaerolineales bacterium]